MNDVSYYLVAGGGFFARSTSTQNLCRGWGPLDIRYVEIYKINFKEKICIC